MKFKKTKSTRPRNLGGRPIVKDSLLNQIRNMEVSNTYCLTIPNKKSKDVSATAGMISRQFAGRKFVCEADGKNVKIWRTA